MSAQYFYPAHTCWTQHRKSMLSPSQYKVLRTEATELPYSRWAEGGPLRSHGFVFFCVIKRLHRGYRGYRISHQSKIAIARLIKLLHARNCGVPGINSNFSRISPHLSCQKTKWVTLNLGLCVLLALEAPQSASVLIFVTSKCCKRHIFVTLKCWKRHVFVTSKCWKRHDNHGFSSLNKDCRHGLG